MRVISIVGALAIGLAAAPALADPTTIAVCSPGSPGTTAEAQPALDAFAAAASAKAGVKLAAVYDDAEDAGVTRLKTAGVAMVSLPFFLKHEKELGLHARLQAQPKGLPPLEQWTLVAKKGRIKGAAMLDGFTIVSNAAFAPAFVKGSVLGGFGALPATVKLQQSGAVLSALRKAANGDPIAVVLDGTQQASLASLPFAAQLEVVVTSPAMPAGVVASVDSKLTDKLWAPIGSALAALGGDAAGKAALDGIQMANLAPIDDKALTAARTTFAAVK